MTNYFEEYLMCGPLPDGRWWAINVRLYNVQLLVGNPESPCYDDAW